MVEAAIYSSLAGVMIGYGESYKETCNNGATDYLVTGGIIILCSNLLPVAIMLVVYLALCDNVIIKAESCGIKMLLPINSLLPIIGIVIAIWVRMGHNKHSSIILIPDQSWTLLVLPTALSLCVADPAVGLRPAPYLSHVLHSLHGRSTALLGLERRD